MVNRSIYMRPKQQEPGPLVPRLDERVVEKIALAMFALDPTNPEHAAILETAGLKGIIPAQDRDFDPVRELVHKLELD